MYLALMMMTALLLFVAFTVFGALAVERIVTQDWGRKVTMYSVTSVMCYATGLLICASASVYWS